MYDDVYNFVPLKNGMESAKVCTDDQSFCCLAEFDADFSEKDVFSLGNFKIFDKYHSHGLCPRHFQGRSSQRWKYCRSILVNHQIELNIKQVLFTCLLVKD